jgi:non-heme chloroperoxidase
MNKAITTRTARPAEVLREGAFANFMRHAAMSVDFENESRAPMLFIAFEHDHIIPPKVARHNAEKYKVNPVEFKESPGRPHFPGAPGWEEVADYALTWAVEHAKTPAPVSAS